MRYLGKYLSVLFALFAATGFASPKTLVIGTGNCTEEAFLKNIEMLTGVAQKKGEVDLIQLTLLFEKRKHLSPKPIQEEQQLLETVHSKILHGDPVAALKDIEQILDALEKAAPSLESWKLISKALAMKGFALSNQRKTRPSEEAFMEILKLDPNHALDPLVFPPTIVQGFERLREALSKRPKATLSLASSPEGAMVFVNGAPLGQTPWERELLPGHYRIVVEKEGKISNPAMVGLEVESPVHLEIPLQWDTAWRTPFCIQAQEEEALPMSLQMAKELGAGYLIKVDMLGKEKGIRAALFDLHRGEKRREGGILLGSYPDEERLDKLMGFMVSGKLEKSESIVCPVDEQGRLICPMRRELPLPLPGPRAQGNAARAVSWVFIGAGSALGLGGGLIYAHSLKSASDAKELLRRHGGDENLTRASSDGFAYRAILAQQEDRQKKALIVGVAGAASLATGLVLFFALPPKAEESLGIAPHFGSNGGGIVLTGRF